MKAKQVYEFIKKKSLRNTLKDDIGINKIAKDKVKEYLNKYSPKSNFYFDRDLLIIDLIAINCSKINDIITEFIPWNKILIEKKLIIGHCEKLTSLSSVSNLIVNKEVYFYKTPIIEYPKEYYFKEHVSISNSKIDNLPNNFNNGFIYGTLDINNTNISNLNFVKYIEEQLFIYNTKITEIPYDLYVGGRIFISKDMVNNLIMSNKHREKLKLFY